MTPSRYSSTTDAPYVPEAHPDTRPYLSLCDQSRQLVWVVIGMYREEVPGE